MRHRLARTDLSSRTETAIDHAFSKMAADADYQRDSISLAREFESSDIEVFVDSRTAGA
jgi:hypothetical protein